LHPGTAVEVTDGDRATYWCVVGLVDDGGTWVQVSGGHGDVIVGA